MNFFEKKMFNLFGRKKNKSQKVDEQQKLVSTEQQEVPVVDKALSVDAQNQVFERQIEVPSGDVGMTDETSATFERHTWFSRLKKGLSRTGRNISQIFVNTKVDEALFDELETALLMADAGIEATQSLLTQLRDYVRKEHIEDPVLVKQRLIQLVTDHLKVLEAPFDIKQDRPLVVMLAGVNGAGKTTTIGKLAPYFQSCGASVLLAAGDTFRAAAREQLMEWGQRNHIHVIAQENADPAAVAFDAVQSGLSKKMDIIMVDTAGRLPNQLHLMEELKKIKRVVKKSYAKAPHEILLVIDGNQGQNVLNQIKAFDNALGLTGLIVTKLDGTAKGGILAAVAAGSHGVRPVPVYWIGIGESAKDLRPFNATEFAQALLS